MTHHAPTPSALACKAMPPDVPTYNGTTLGTLNERKNFKPHRRLIGLVVLALLVLPIVFHHGAPTAHAAEQELNIYSARHYSSDDALYAEFTKKTGIRINQIQAGDEAILERLKSEGKASPADVILLADAARLWKAQNEGLFQPAQSAVLKTALPKDLQANDLWFGLTTRARLIVYDKKKVRPSDIKNYADLAKPEFKGKVCTRSGAHPYMLSLLASVIANEGEAKAEAWARDVVANLARPPRGGDTDQIKAVASGECAVALTNSYYLVRMLKSANTTEKEAAASLGVVWPNQTTTGTHVNVSGGGIARYAPHPQAARQFLEFLVSESAQAQFANANNEWPAVRGVKINNPELTGLGSFKADRLAINAIGQRQPQAAQIMDRVGWK